MKTRSLLLLELNEINFDLAAKYVDQLGLENFRKLLASGVRRTTSEDCYENLEPWIQWVSAHSGLTAAEHGVSRLGDIVGSDVPQIYEFLEDAGLSVGAISPMNAENRLRNPAYFIPDPWTRTASDGSWWSQALQTAIGQAVNDNSEGRISARNKLILIGSVLRFARAKHYYRYIILALRSRRAPWRKALVLDLLLNDIHWTLYRRKRPAFSSLFLNGGAHIQHHYYLNSIHENSGLDKNPGWYIHSSADPIGEMFSIYDAIIGDFLSSGIDTLIATGLTQQPYPKVTFYYRLKNHADFLSRLGITFRAVLPRMTRDFLIEFESEADAREAEERLARLTLSSDGEALFEEIDNRGRDLFVTLTYSNEVEGQAVIIGATTPITLADHVIFVAVKNGMHDGRGFVCAVGGGAKILPPEGEHVKFLFHSVLDFFGLTAPQRTRL